ncbi:MAG: bifunctional (p)ppGpp synthetase/guanosine-3',5'-bis(diphosphate) 3'-pyrophosphohydrolase [Acidobacteria bacterium]|nr:bifunctional (p)ppGpp synthetase/guanosine-3',5'-bis(diphosphate) 3'-pyrophosphohydrolase [Acidobacteriota bacterium]
MATEPLPVTNALSIPVNPEPWEVPQVAAAYAQLEKQVKASRPNDDLSALRRTFEKAAYWHRNRKRATGDPYILHPIAVSGILADEQMDMTCLQSGLLHDVVEDEDVHIDEIRRTFGDDVARVVDGVTKLGKLKLANREERQAESLRKMLLAMTTDIRVIIVKLADRMHNLQTLGALSRERQERISTETLDIYVPIAHRLGMGKIRGQLEDIAFQYQDPEASQELMKEMESRRQANQEYLNMVKHAVEVKLARDHIPARVEGRLKRPFSIYQKMKRQRIGMDQVYDLLALRIITDSVKNCYAALGVIHNEWHPIMGRIKDFIAIPRPNLYQSLHTSVIGPGGHSFEVQIRTEEMHHIAEEGIAAHWKYKEGKKGPADDDQRIAWLRHLVEWQKEMNEPQEFMSTLRVELYAEEVYCFTPKGRVIVLPRDASPLDFAYAIHSDVGNTCVGAKVNGRIVPLKYQLRNGDVVEILTQQGHLPSKDWLALVKTSRARNKIRHFINASERAKAIEIGEKFLEKEARRLGVSLSRIAKDRYEQVASEYGHSKMEDVYASLGYGRFSARHILQKLAPESVPEAEPAKPPAPAPVFSATGSQVFPPGQDLVVKVKGIDDVLVYRAKCCNPIRGEAIVGYVTRGKGIAVHSQNCKNVQSLLYEPERRIDVEWARAVSETFTVKMMVYSEDRPGMLHEITSIFYNENTNIRSVEARMDDKRSDDSAIVDLTCEVKDKRQMEKIISALRRIPGVRDVERVQ